LNGNSTLRDDATQRRHRKCRVDDGQFDDGQFADTTLDRLAVDDVIAGLPVREFRSDKGRQHYSGWYW
jgi:hypothetical protein